MAASRERSRPAAARSRATRGSPQGPCIDDSTQFTAGTAFEGVRVLGAAQHARCGHACSDRRARATAVGLAEHVPRRALRSVSLWSPVRGHPLPAGRTDSGGGRPQLQMVLFPPHRQDHPHRLRGHVSPLLHDPLRPHPGCRHPPQPNAFAARPEVGRNLDGIVRSVAQPSSSLAFPTAGFHPPRGGKPQTSRSRAPYRSRPGSTTCCHAHI